MESSRPAAVLFETIGILMIGAGLAAACGGAEQGPRASDDPTHVEPDSSNDDACPEASPALIDETAGCEHDGLSCAYDGDDCRDVFVCACIEGCGWTTVGKQSCPVSCDRANNGEACTTTNQSCDRPPHEVGGAANEECKARCTAGRWAIECTCPSPPCQ